MNRNMYKLLKRKVDNYLLEWKNNPDRKPLIIKGARQVGKTRSIEWFASHNYQCVIQINFVEQKRYRDIFEDVSVSAMQPFFLSLCLLPLLQHY